jgi:hypothetical protein
MGAGRRVREHVACQRRLPRQPPLPPTIPGAACLRGFYCPNSTTIVRCPAGHWCPEQMIAPQREWWWWVWVWEEGGEGICFALYGRVAWSCATLPPPTAPATAHCAYHRATRCARHHASPARTVRATTPVCRPLCTPPRPLAARCARHDALSPPAVRATTPVCRPLCTPPRLFAARCARHHACLPPTAPASAHFACHSTLRMPSRRPLCAPPRLFAAHIARRHASPQPAAFAATPPPPPSPAPTRVSLPQRAGPLRG